MVYNIFSQRKMQLRDEKVEDKRSGCSCADFTFRETLLCVLWLRSLFTATGGVCHVLPHFSAFGTAKMIRSLQAHLGSGTPASFPDIGWKFPGALFCLSNEPAEIISAAPCHMSYKWGPQFMCPTIYICIACAATIGACSNSAAFHWIHTINRNRVKKE